MRLLPLMSEMAISLIEGLERYRLDFVNCSWQDFSLFVRGVARRLHVNDVSPHIRVVPFQAEWSNLNFCVADNPPTASSVASHDQFPLQHEETKERERAEKHLCSLQSHLVLRSWGSCRRRTIIEAPQAEF